MNTPTEEQLIDFFIKTFAETPTSILKLPEAGSYRAYYRIISTNHKAIGAFNQDIKENTAFLSFTKHFYSSGLPVPEIYYESEDKLYYLLEDLGDTTLYSFIIQHRENYIPTDQLFNVYKNVLNKLPQFQIQGRNIDYSVCYPRNAFDRQSMMWDLNYFKYYFLKLAKIPFDEQLLEDDFNFLCDHLTKADDNYFLYRDFQSHNIMLKDQIPYFIDYQGGRKGALQYDLASLLYDSKADLRDDIRNDLLEHYLEVLSMHINLNRNDFMEYYPGFVLLRIMQAMGAYGFRGFYERKEIFLKSVPYAIRDLKSILKDIQIKIPHLLDTLKRLTESQSLLNL